MMKRFTTWAAIGFCAALLAAGSALAEPQPEALTILKKVDAAIKAVDSVSYSMKVTPEGVAAQRMNPVQGEVTFTGWTGNGPEKVYSMAKTTDADGKVVEVSGGGNGDMYFVMDHQTKKAYVDMDPGVMGSTGAPLRNLLMVEFVHDAPFDDELGADTAELLGKIDIEGEECNQIRVVYSGGRGESIWAFSTKDNLPRQRIQVFSGPQGDGKLIRTLSNLKVSPKLDASLFALNLPEGFEQIDDFAP